MNKDNTLAKVTYYVSLDAGPCTGCWNCIEACPLYLLVKKPRRTDHPHPLFFNPEECVGCGECIDTCTNNVFTAI